MNLIKTKWIVRLLVLFFIFPSTLIAQKWRAIAPMHAARTQESAIVLSDGRIMVAGGEDGSQALPSCEIYNPSTNTWSMTTPMHEARYRFPMIMLHDGRVMVAGGLTDMGVGTTAGVELYDPKTAVWTQMAPMHDPREDFSLFQVPNGKVFICGGLNANVPVYLTSTEFFNPATNTYQQLSSMLTAVFAYFTFYDSVKNIISEVGGSFNGLNGVYPPIVQVYDVATNTWSNGANTAIPHPDGYSVQLADTTTLLIAGRTGPYTATDTVEVLQPGSTAWQFMGRLTSPRWHGHSAVLGDSIIVFGGDNDPGVDVNILDSTNWFLIKEEVALQGPRMISPRTNFASAVTNPPMNVCQQSGTVYALGGYSTSGRILNLCEALIRDTSQDTSSNSLPEMIAEQFAPVEGCVDTSVWEPISIGCSQFRIDSVRIQGDSANVFHLSTYLGLPHVIENFGSDSIRVFFAPYGQSGTFRASLHLFGTLLGTGVKYDTIISLLATSTSTGNPLPTIRYTPFVTVPSCTNGDAYAYFQMGCAQFRIDSARIELDTGNAFTLDPTQKFPQLLNANKSDSIHVLFNPKNRVGAYGARLHLFGTDIGSGLNFDTIVSLTASSVIPIPVFYSFPPEVQWSSLVECSSGDTTVTFENQGCDTVSADSLHLVQGVTLTSQGLTLPVMVAPNHTLSLRVHFTPDGLKSDSLQALLYYSTPTFSDSIPVAVKAHAEPAPPVLASNVSKVNFGQMPSCDTVDTVIYLKDDGCDSLTITSLSGLANGFVVDPAPTLPITLAKGDSVGLHIRYHAITTRDTQTVFVGTKNAGQSSTLKFSLSGQIRIEPLSIPTGSINLSSVAICGSDDTTITVSNPGCDTMVITSAQLSQLGDIQLSGVTLPIIIPPHSAASFHLHFSSASAENASTTLLLDYEDAGLHQPEIGIPINAVATRPIERLSLSDTSLSIASIPICESDSLYTTLYNTTCDTLVVSANNLTGDKDFVLISPTDSVRLLPGDSVHVKIAVLPHAKGNRTGTLQVSYWNSLRTIGIKDSLIDLSAFITNGTARVVQSFSSANLGTISECISRDTSVTLQNLGCDTLTLDSASLDNTYFLLNPNTVTSLQIPPDSSFTWNIGTNLDTAGHPSALSTNLHFYSPDTAISPIPIMCSVSYAQPSNLLLVPSANSVPADSNVYYDVRDQTDLSKFGVTDVQFTLHSAQDIFSYQYVLSSNIVHEDSSVAGGIVNYYFRITGSPVRQLPDGTLARLWFKAYVAKETQTSVWIDSTRLNPEDSSFERCVASLLPPQDTTFSVIQACGDNALEEFLSGQHISMNVQTSATGSILRIFSPNSGLAHLRISNLLGATVCEENLSLTSGETVYPITATLPNGAFFLLLSNEAGPLARASMINIAQ